MSQNDRSLDPLMALLSQSERERDEAVADAQKASAAHDAAQLQAEQLVQYRSEYEGRFRVQFSTHNSIEMLQTYQGFSSRLNLAIDKQQQVATHAGIRLERARALVREQEVRVASVRKLIERRLHELRLVADRRDQKQTDEFAARAAWNRLAQQPLLPAG